MFGGDHKSQSQGIDSSARKPVFGHDTDYVVEKTYHLAHYTMWNGVHINLDTIRKSLKSANHPNWLIFSGKIKNMRMFHDHFFQTSQKNCF